MAAVDFHVLGPVSVTVADQPQRLRPMETGYSHLAVVPWLVKRCCRARWALRSRIRDW